jgi:putative ABC transport system permease protein
MKTFLKLAWRNIWRNKRRSFISIGAVLFAVLFAIAADSFERGSYELMIQNMVKFSTGYIQIQDVLYDDEPSIDNSMLYDESLLEVLDGFGDRISYTVPRIHGFALAATGSRTRGISVMGIDPVSEDLFNDLSENITRGSYLEEDDNAVLLAGGLAEILGLGVGDTLVIIGQGFQGATAAGMYPVKGIVSLSIPEMNNNTVYMPLAAAQWFYAADDRISALIIMPENPRHTGRITGELNERLDSEWYTALPWQHMLQDLLRMMQVDRAGSQLIIFILYIVIGFGLFGTILTMMLERLREFAMLLALGMKRFQLAIICLLESFFMSFTGVIAGILITFPIIYYFNRNPIPLGGELAGLMDDYGFEAVLPTSIEPTIFITQAVTVFIIALLIGLYPAYKALKLNIVHHSK